MSLDTLNAFIQTRAPESNEGTQITTRITGDKVDMFLKVDPEHANYAVHEKAKHGKCQEKATCVVMHRATHGMVQLVTWFCKQWRAGLKGQDLQSTYVIHAL